MGHAAVGGGAGHAAVGGGAGYAAVGGGVGHAAVGGGAGHAAVGGGAGHAAVGGGAGYAAVGGGAGHAAVGGGAGYAAVSGGVGHVACTVTSVWGRKVCKRSCRQSSYTETAHTHITCGSPSPPPTHTARQDQQHSLITPHRSHRQSRLAGVSYTLS